MPLLDATTQNDAAAADRRVPADGQIGHLSHAMFSQQLTTTAAAAAAAAVAKMSSMPELLNFCFTVVASEISLHVVAKMSRIL
jgi:hypothetical protein